MASGNLEPIEIVIRERDLLGRLVLKQQDGELFEVLQNFYVAMHSKLGRSLAGGKQGWSDDDWTIEDVVRQLKKSIDKGDPVDVANFALFWWYKTRTE